MPREPSLWRAAAQYAKIARLLQRLLTSMKSIQRETAVRAWVKRAATDFFASFLLEDLLFLRLFFYHQGVEKLCKAYLIGTHAYQYENLTADQAMKWIDDFARSLKHDLSTLVGLIFTAEPTFESFARDKKFVMALMKGYEEGRYPTPSSKSVWRVPGYPYVGSTQLDQKAYQLGSRLLDCINRRFQLSISIQAKPSGVDGKTWDRFVRTWRSRSA